ncbi:MAG: A/G-specific adenine glycosylase [Christensenellales bacterium]|jgi:A/G-specific adenine glycosylase
MKISYTRIADTLCDWFDKNQRDLPWRHTDDPYAIWVAEIMLQQTRVEAVLNHYTDFMRRFPNIAALAQSSSEEIKLAWRGLGYYRRAENLRLGAIFIIEHYNGVFPNTLDAIRSIPGVGAYTAGAIASFAYDIPVPAVDGNVLRVISRICNLTDSVDTPAVHSLITEIVRRMIPANRVWSYNQGLMELGAIVCLPGNPCCQRCPLIEYCLGFAAGNPELLPVRRSKNKPVVLNREVFLVRNNGTVLLHRRPETGLLAGLWEFPGKEAPEFPNLPVESMEKRFILHARHVFTHIIWEMDGYEIHAAERFSLPSDNWRWVPLTELHSYAIPSAMNSFLAFLLPGK